jgi:hypothetical protein
MNLQPPDNLGATPEEFDDAMDKAMLQAAEQGKGAQ